MSFRITTLVDGNETTIRVEGRLGAEGVPELQREVRLTGEVARLDLEGLTSADTEGLQELLQLSVKGVELVGASAYIRQLLDQTR